MNTVVSVSVKKTGVGKKGPWTMFEAVLDNGVKASGFDAVSEGDSVEVQQQGQYLNYTKVGNGGARKPSAAPRSAPPATRGNDDRSNRIERQHSQEMAIRWFALTTITEPLTTEKLRSVIDWFQRDVGNMPTTASSKPEPAEAPNAEGPDPDEEPF